MSDDEKVIQLSNVKMSLLLGGAVAFVALGIWAYQLNPLVGIAAVLFFGLCAVFALRKLFDKKPGLVLGPSGIVDNSSGVAAGHVPWTDIAGFDVMAIERQRFLVVKLTNPEKYVEAGGSMRRAVNRMNMKMCGSPVTISSNALKVRFDELVNLCNSYYAKYGRR